ncbi:MAG: regulatory protein RecX [Firmicutes bacterium]|nr:regulatory protein RecX [Bacillota bacterium]
MIKGKKELTFQQAKDKALRLLEFRAHSEKELRDKLLRAGAKEEDLTEITDFLKRYSFINDADYAERLARDLKKLKKYGKRRIRRELSAKGIADECAQAALDGLVDDETDVLLPLIEKKLGGNFEKKSIDKTIRYFMYRGYGFGDIKHCIEQITAQSLE